MTDIVDDFIARLRAIAPNLPEHAPTQLETQLREAWGGSDRGYIAKRPMRRHAIRIGESLRGQVSITDVINESGLSRASVYRVLKMKKKYSR